MSLGAEIVDRTVNWLRSDRFGVSWVGGRTDERHEEALIEELGTRAWVRLTSYDDAERFEDLSPR